MAQNEEGDKIPDISTYIWVEETPVPLNLENVKAGISYPYKAIKDGIEGTLFVRVLVDENGNYQTHKITRHIHPLLSEALDPHIEKLHFSPAMRNDVPLKYWLNMSFDFKITEAVRKQATQKKYSPDLLAGLRRKDTQDRHLADGMDELNEQQYDRAILAFTRGIMLSNPDKTPVSAAAIRSYLYRSQAYMALAKWEQADADLTEALGRIGALQHGSVTQSLRAQLYLNRGLARLYLDRPVDALADFNWLHRHLSSQLYHPGWSLLETHLGQETYRNALPLLVQLAYYNAENPIVDFLIGHTCKRLEMDEAAAKAFIGALSKAGDPTFKAFLYDHLGETLLDLGQYAEALSSAHEATLLTPGHPLPHYNQAIALMKLNHRKAALDALETALDMGLPEPEMTTARSILQQEKNKALAGKP